MNRLQSLYQSADRLGLQVQYFHFRTQSAISTPDGFIGIDPEKVSSDARELVCLAHEMGHCLTGTFYTLESDATRRRRCEERANRWAMDSLVPLPELKLLLEKGITEPHELAEHFGVPEDFLRRCLDYYHEAKGAW